MKYIFLLILSFTLLITACSGNDECVQADWVGVYKGKSQCNSSNELSATIVILAGENDNALIINGIETTFDGTCSASTSVNASSLSSPRITDYSLNGNNLSFRSSTTNQGFFIICDFEGSKE